VLVLLPIWIDYFNGCARARSLDIAAQIKIMGEPSLVFTGLWFGIYLGLPSEKYKIVSWKKKEFKDLDFVIIRQLVYLYHVLFVAINICGIDYNFFCIFY
jgi:hypothetical protein